MKCQHRLDGELAPHVCAACGTPQPVATAPRAEPLIATPQADYFAALGAPRRFNQDLETLQKRYYTLSRALHPDRFAAAEASVRQASLERMSLVNQAFNTLRDPAELRTHLLQLEGVEAVALGQGQKAGTIPLELAEAWFDLQDLLTEDPARAAVQAAGFASELQGYREARETEIVQAEAAYDQAPASAALQDLARKIQGLAYLDSLKRDVDRVRAQVA